MSNQLTDLNTHLFAQLERLEHASDETLENEVKRSKSITDVSKVVVENARLALEAEKYKTSNRVHPDDLPRMLGGGND